MNISVDIEINSPQNMVQAAITDIKNSSKMISGIINVKIIEQPADGMVGLKWNETRKILGKEVTEKMQITDCKDKEYYCTRAENCGAIYLTKMSVAEHNQKTMLTMTFLWNV